MSEAENLGENMEAAAPEAENIAQDQANQATTANETVQETEQEKNWRAMREKLEEQQRIIEEQKKRQEEYEQILYQQIEAGKKQAEPEVDEFADVQPDDWLTYEQSKKLAERQAMEAVKKALEEDRKKRSEEELPTRLKSQFNDFEAVVTDANIKQLREQEPEIAVALSQIGDKYAQAVAAYKYIKKFVPEAAQQTEYKQRVEQNQNRPGSVAQSSSLAKATSFEKGLTPDLKKQLYQEMMQAARQG
jgi:hypothetical protein